MVDPPEALMDHDILTLIFEHFDLQAGSNDNARTRKDLLAAAKTCKAFVEPALNQLWRVLPSLLPLLLLLPSAQVNNNHYVSHTLFSCLSCRLTSIKFVDRLPLRKWERFDLHAPRVRTLYMEKLNIVISPHVYLRIRSMRDAPLLPGLKEIYIPDNAFDLSSALLLASQSDLNLVQLNNSATSDRQFFIPFLYLLSINSPNLVHLTLCGTSNTSLDLVPRFTSLQSLDLRFSGTHLDSQLLQDLGNLDNLLDLTLDTGPSTETPTQQQPDLPPSTNHPIFKKLRKLHILGTPRTISCVLNEMNVLVNLTTIIIHETTDQSGPDTEGAWKRCFAIISAFPAIEDIEITQLPASWRSHYALSISCFFPLLKLVNVTSFVVNNSTLSGSDDDFRFLACAFPKLKKFVEPCASYSEGRTLARLLYFSQANQDLREMKVSIASNIGNNLKAINAINTPGHPLTQNQQHPLRKLCIASQFGNFSSPSLPDMIQIAQFLDLIFPNLSTLEAYGSCTSEASTWTQIQHIRVALQAARIKASSATMNMASMVSFYD